MFRRRIESPGRTIQHAIMNGGDRRGAAMLMGTWRRHESLRRSGATVVMGLATLSLTAVWLWAQTGGSSTTASSYAFSLLLLEDRAVQPPPTPTPITPNAASETQNDPPPVAEPKTNDPPIQREDADCPFRDSPLYRRVYAYPNYNETEFGWGTHPEIMSAWAWQNLDQLKPWPWLEMDQQARHNRTGHYNVHGQKVQYTTELLVREVLLNPRSCLRTFNPQEATLFYVPYLPSIEHHRGSDSFNVDYSTSPWGQAIMNILDQGDYTAWEQTFGLTSKFWQRRGGADHILVFSEPMHGLYHPRSRRGNFHFLHSQKQTKPPIVISVELSTTFVQMYPKCAAKNILMPYPNTNGLWFNGRYQQDAETRIRALNITAANSVAAAPAERQLASQARSTTSTVARPVTQFYSAGNHGTCTVLRKAMQTDYQTCSPSYRMLRDTLQADRQYWLGMLYSTFCPCPGGDSPSAKRMFDALLTGCIPVILSWDFVWPFTPEFDPTMTGLNPADFSIRYAAQDFEQTLLDAKTCQPLNASRPGLEATLQALSEQEIQRLREGVARAADVYSWYRLGDEGLPENPLQEGVLPNGGLAHALVRALADRAEGKRWPACEEELKLPRPSDPNQFKC